MTNLRQLRCAIFIGLSFGLNSVAFANDPKVVAVHEVQGNGPNGGYVNYDWYSGGDAYCYNYPVCQQHYPYQCNCHYVYGNHPFYTTYRYYDDGVYSRNHYYPLHSNSYPYDGMPIFNTRFR